MKRLLKRAGLACLALTVLAVGASVVLALWWIGNLSNAAHNITNANRATRSH